MTNEEITRALVKYRVLEEQKLLLEEQQESLKDQISAHMVAINTEKVETNGVVAQLVARNKYNFDVKGILMAVPEAIESLKLTDAAFTKLLKGNEAKIGAMRTLVSQDKSLTIRMLKE